MKKKEKKKKKNKDWIITYYQWICKGTKIYEFMHLRIEILGKAIFEPIHTQYSLRYKNQEIWTLDNLKIGLHY